VLAVSVDDLETLKRFKEDRKATYQFLSDPGGKVAAQYSGLMPVVGLASRANFVIGKDGKVISIVTGGDAIDPGASVDACPSSKG
jgi:thioredoxin-dependent peroxiredoxin